MKTTLDLDDSLLKKAKAFAAREGVTLTLLIEEGLRLRLRRAVSTQAVHTLNLPLYKGKGGVAAGIDPTSNHSLFEAAGDDA